VDFAVYASAFLQISSCFVKLSVAWALADVGAAVDLLVDVLHEVGLNSTQSSGAGEVSGDVTLGVVSSDSRSAFAFERTGRALHGCNRYGRLAIDVYMQIHNVVH